MKLTKQKLKRIIKEELENTGAPIPDFHADVTKLIKKIGYLEADIDDMNLEDPGALILRIEQLYALARDVARNHDIDIYG